MIVIITGASHTGKTVLAQRMLEKYKYPYLSVDHLKMGLIRSGNTELTPMDDDELVGYLWPIVREMIKTAIENRQNLIVEGCYIPYYWRKDFDDDYLSEIRFICLAMTDSYIDAHFEDIRNHGSDIENRLDDSDCTAGWIKEENQKVIEGFRCVGERIILINDDYGKVITEILNEVKRCRLPNREIGGETMLEILKARFQDNKNLHMELSWLDVEKRLLEHPGSMDVLRRMEESGGEPDTIGYDEKTGKLIFCDCAKESPSGRRSLCYDEKALQGRAKNPPSGSAEWKAKEIGVLIMTEELYRRLQSLGEFDLKTSSWITTPDDIRDKGGALFCERRYGTVFTFHNGADSYYSVRGFRGYTLI